MKEKEATENLNKARKQQEAKVAAAKASADAAEDETPEKLEAVAAHEAIATGEEFAPGLQIPLRLAILSHFP